MDIACFSTKGAFHDSETACLARQSHRLEAGMMGEHQHGVTDGKWAELPAFDDDTNGTY